MQGRHDPIEILRHMLRYCEQAESIHQEYSYDRSRFDQSYAYRNGLAMCIMQIGEMVKYLPDDYKAAHPEIPWRQIYATRNYVAHDYGAVDFDVVWDASLNGLKEIADFCGKQLDDADVEE